MEHLIVSHHGELEFGSPKIPLFPEAMLLHHLDNLDSKMECMRSMVAKDRHVDGCWTGYSASLDRAVLKKAKYLDEALIPSEPAPSVAPSPAPIPQPQPQPAQPQHKEPPPLQPVPSAFAEKLQQAWRKES